MGINAYDQLSYAKFDPLSIQEIWAPGQAIRQQHDIASEDYAEQEKLGQASLLNIDKVKDKAAYDAQQAYLNSLREKANALATKGFIDSGRRQGINEIRSMYNQTILPYQSAYTNRAAKDDEFRKMKIANPDLIHGIAPGDKSLDEGLNNPNAYDYKAIKGEQLAKDVGIKAEMWAKTVTDSKSFDAMKSPVARQMFWRIRNGADPNIVLAAIQQDANFSNDPEAQKMYKDLTNIVQETLTDYNIQDITGGDKNQLLKAYDFAAQGLRKAFGKDDIQLIHDTEGAQIAAEWRRKRDAGEENNNAPGWIARVTPIPEVVQQEKFIENLNIINYLKSNKYKTSKATDLFDYAKAKSDIMGDKNLSISDREFALNALAKQSLLDPKSIESRLNKTVEELGRKYKTTNLIEIRSKLEEENEKLKVATSETGIDTEGNTAFKAAYKENPSLFKNFKKDGSKNADADAVSIKWSPTLGVVARGVDGNDKPIKVQLPSSILGNPAAVKELNVDALPKLTSQILNGKVNINEMIKEGELVESKNNKGYYIFAKPLVDVKLNPIGYLPTAYSESELNSALQDHPEVLDYLDRRNKVVANVYDNRLNTVNIKYSLNPNKQ